jgi:hypothetical protein
LSFNGCANPIQDFLVWYIESLRGVISIGGAVTRIITCLIEELLETFLDMIPEGGIFDENMKKAIIYVLDWAMGSGLGYMLVKLLAPGQATLQKASLEATMRTFTVPAVWPWVNKIANFIVFTTWGWIKLHFFNFERADDHLYLLGRELGAKMVPIDPSGNGYRTQCAKIMEDVESFNEPISRCDQQIGINGFIREFDGKIDIKTSIECENIYNDYAKRKKFSKNYLNVHGIFGAMSMRTMTGPAFVEKCLDISKTRYCNMYTPDRYLADLLAVTGQVSNMQTHWKMKNGSVYDYQKIKDKDKNDNAWWVGLHISLKRAKKRKLFNVKGRKKQLSDSLNEIKRQKNSFREKA